MYPEVDEARARFSSNRLQGGAGHRATRPEGEAALAYRAINLDRVRTFGTLASTMTLRAIARNLLAVHPRFSVRRWGRGLPYRYDEHLNALLEPLRFAGLPD